jgi:dihydrofolate reductase
VINLIAATTYCPETGQSIIAVEGRLPQRSPVDMARFKKLTTGGVVIMGRKTFYTLNGALPNRTNIVLSRDPQFHLGKSYVARDLEEALEIASKHSSDIWIIGGGEIYKQALALDLPDLLYISEMRRERSRDFAEKVTVFPEIDTDKYKILSVEDFEDHCLKILSKNSLDVL